MGVNRNKTQGIFLSLSLSLLTTRLTTKKKRTYVRGDLISYTIMQEVYYHFSSKFRLEIQKVLRNSLVRDSLILYTSDLSRYRLSKSLQVSPLHQFCIILMWRDSRSFERFCQEFTSIHLFRNISWSLLISNFETNPTSLPTSFYPPKLFLYHHKNIITHYKEF